MDGAYELVDTTGSLEKDTTTGDFQETELTRKNSKHLRALFFTAVTCFASAGLVKSFAALTDDEVNKDKGCQRVCPPETEELVEEQANQEGKGHIGAGNATHGIGFEGGAANVFGDAQLALPEERHDDCRR
jgi:hypothetical protein